MQAGHGSQEILSMKSRVTSGKSERTFKNVLIPGSLPRGSIARGMAATGVILRIAYIPISSGITGPIPGLTEKKHTRKGRWCPQKTIKGTAGKSARAFAPGDHVPVGHERP